ncbi:MAG TPA: universal stress protein [Acidimicrobiales bacterium]|nr:universal stress protein [Acidimicrobiales bacterium]
MTGGQLRIVVAVDDSEGAARAVRFVARLAPSLGAEVVAVHALGLLAHLGGETAVPAQAHRDEVRALLERWAGPLADAGVPYRCEVVDGNPVQALLSAAADEGADVIVVGKRAAIGVPGLQLGSTSQQLVQHADIPVVVVPG